MNRKETVETTSSYVALASQTYGLFVDAAASANQRALGYWKSLYEIASRPYASTAVENAVRENFDRANQVVSLTINELQANGAKSAEFTEKLASVLHRAAFLPVPAVALKAMLGEGATIALDGQRVIPERTLATAYSFRHTHLEPALRSLLR